jgi:uncharacterized protein involved in exopolysaccharide biosynthesis/Mrp family chromosome partitioning ATPase
MSDSENIQQSSSLGVNDILFVLFRHKLMLLFFFLLAIGAATGVFYLKKPLYESTAKLFIRYVSENTALQSAKGNADVIHSPDNNGKAILNSEIEILTSQDSLVQAAKAYGPEKILGPGANEFEAASALLDRLKVETGDGGTISVTLGNRNPEVAQGVLTVIIDEYLRKHIKVHNPEGTYDFLQSQTDQLQTRLKSTEEQLRAEKIKAGITSLPDAKAEITTQSSALRKALLEAESQLAERKARLGFLSPSSRILSSNLNTQTSETTNAIARTSSTNSANPEDIATYKRLAQQLSALKTKELENLATFTEISKPVRQIRQQIKDTEEAIQELGIDPSSLSQASLATVNPILPSTGFGNGLEQDRAEVRGLEAKIEVLKAQLGILKDRATKIDEVENTINELQIRKERQQEEYKYFQDNLEHARIDQLLESGKSNNISVVQKPSLAGRDLKKLKKTVGMAFGAVLALGFGLAFGIDMLFDPSVKQGKEIENRLKIPVLVTIPAIAGYKKRKKGSGSLQHISDGELSAFGEIAPWDNNDPMMPYYEGLRDRIVMSYNGDLHKPKVIGLTSCHKGAGVSRIAIGLAASLSRDVQRNVLLIGLKQNKVALSSFQKGEPVANGDSGEMLPNQEDTHSIRDNLTSLAMTGRNLAGASIAQSFCDLMPKLKVSDYDYVIFDLPPVTQTSGSLRLAAQMERTILVAESEKTDCGKLEKVVKLLQPARGKVCAVLNKHRQYGPRFLTADV